LLHYVSTRISKWVFLFYAQMFPLYYSRMLRFSLQQVKLFHSKTIFTHWKQKSNYLQVAYMILQRVSPVTHSVANCLKRVIVIVSSVIFFQTPVSPINALGNKVASFLLFNHISLHNSCWNWTFYVPIILCRNWYSYFWCFPIFQGKPN
jgi:hypothetical protein